jgi:hypothetical protein
MEACSTAQLGESMTGEGGRSLCIIDGAVCPAAWENWCVEIMVFIIQKAMVSSLRLAHGADVSSVLLRT